MGATGVGRDRGLGRIRAGALGGGRASGSACMGTRARSDSAQRRESERPCPTGCHGTSSPSPWTLTAQAWASDAYGAEPQPEGLTFYGQEHEFGAPPGQEHEDTLVGSLKKLLAQGYWSAAVTFAVITGERDRNKLTNMLFWARHPELDGKKIPPGNKKLADEWKAIYKQLVLPPLGPGIAVDRRSDCRPEEQKSVDTLIIDIFNSEQQVLTAWSGAPYAVPGRDERPLGRRRSTRFRSGAVMKHVGEQVISKIAGQVPGVSYAKGMLDTVTKEYERAREARTSAQLPGLSGQVHAGVDRRDERPRSRLWGLQAHGRDGVSQRRTGREEAVSEGPGGPPRALWIATGRT